MSPALLVRPRVSITPDGRWWQASGFQRQPLPGLVRLGMAALWLGLSPDELRRAGPVIRGPGGRVARLVGEHPSRFLREAGQEWWEVLLEDPEAAALELPEPEPEEEAPAVAVGPAVEPVAAAVLPAAPEPAPEPEGEPLPAPPPADTPEAEPEPPAPEPQPAPAVPASAEPSSREAQAAAILERGLEAIRAELAAIAQPAAEGLAVMPTEAVEIDPRRFQFRQISHHGDLRAVSRWNPDLAGVLSVWRDPADGVVFVVDGHHRAGLARRLQVPSLAVRFLEASSDREARIIGATINIGHGNASPVDAAKLLRDGGLSPEQVAAYGLPPNGRVIRDGLALAQLAPELFEGAAMGTIPHDMALALAAAGPNHTLQRDLWRVARRNGWAAASTREAAEMATLATVRTSAGDGLLPGLEVEESNLEALLAVRAAIRSRLRSEIRALGAATRARDAATLQAAGNVIDREGSRAARSQAQVTADVFAQLVNTAGALADVVRMVADEVTNPGEAAAVVDEHLGLIREAIAHELGSLGL